MIASPVFYFSLLSVTWTSFVRAMTPQQRNEINWFLRYRGPDLLDAFHHLPGQTLGAYFTESVHNFQTALGSYLNDLDVEVRLGQHPAPPPANNSDFYRELAGFTRLVNLIKYCNFRLLNDLMVNLLSTYGQHEIIGPESILWMINDDKVTSAWVEYAKSRPFGGGKPFRTHMVDIAILYSMNASMLDLIGLNDPQFGSLVGRVADYQHMIMRLHSSMARYLQIDTLRWYDDIFATLGNDLIQFDTNVDIGDRMIQTRRRAFDLSNHILAVIAIYGCPPRTEFHLLPGTLAIPGTETLFNLFESRWAIRRLIGQKIFMDVRDDHWILWVMRSLRKELLKIENVRNLYGGWTEWVLRLREIVNMALSMLVQHAPVEPTGTNYPPARAGPSGTN
jgi:hypothetical protein